MKYLKLFESNKYYTEVGHEYVLDVYGSYDYNDYNDYNDDSDTAQFILDNWIPFTDDEIKQIMDLFHRHGSASYKYNNSKYTIPNFDEMPIPLANINIKIIDKDRLNIRIIKLKDEWYYVIDGKFSGRDSRVYKCDQFEGLMNCLENISKEI